MIRIPTLWIAPAVLSMNVGSHLSLTEMAVNPARVIPAAKGCYKRLSPLRIANKEMTYTGNAHIVFIAYMDILDSDLEVVDYLCDQRGPQALGLLWVICDDLIQWKDRDVNSIFTSSWGLRLSSHMQQLGVFQSFSFSSLCPPLFFFRIYIRLRTWDDEKIYIFDEDFDGLIAQVHPMQGQGKFTEVACFFINLRSQIRRTCARSPSRTSTGNLNLSKAPFFIRRFRNVSWPMKFVKSAMIIELTILYLPWPIP